MLEEQRRALDGRAHADRAADGARRAGHRRRAQGASSQASPLRGKYEAAVDSESAYEMLAKRKQMAEQPAQEASTSGGLGGILGKITDALGGGSQPQAQQPGKGTAGPQRMSTTEVIIRSMATRRRARSARRSRGPCCATCSAASSAAPPAVAAAAADAGAPLAPPISTAAVRAAPAISWATCRISSRAAARRSGVDLEFAVMRGLDPRIPM